jgi:hypothetical protein
LSIGRAKVFFRVGAAENVSRNRQACRKSSGGVFDCEQLAKFWAKRWRDTADKSLTENPLVRLIMPKAHEGAAWANSPEAGRIAGPGSP